MKLKEGEYPWGSSTGNNRREAVPRDDVCRFKKQTFRHSNDVDDLIRTMAFIVTFSLAPQTDWLTRS